MLTKFYSFILGENPKVFENYQTSTKKKLTTGVLLLFIPVIIWMCNGFLLSKEIFELNLIESAIVAFILGTIIFIVERSILISKSNGWIKFFRFILGALIAILGAIIFDEILFKDDIQNQLSKDFSNELRDEKLKIDAEFRSEIEERKSKVKEYEINFNNAAQEWIKEADGNGGSGKSGLGQITELKKQNMLTQKEYLEKEKMELSKLLNNLEDKKEKRVEEYKSTVNTKGILTKIKGLFNIIKTDWVCRIVFILYFFLIGLLEFIVIVFKFASTEETIDEKIEKLREKTIHDRNLKLQQGINGFWDVQKTDEILRKPASLYKK